MLLVFIPDQLFAYHNDKDVFDDPLFTFDSSSLSYTVHDTNNDVDKEFDLPMFDGEILMFRSAHRAEIINNYTTVIKPCISKDEAMLC